MKQMRQTSQKQISQASVLLTLMIAHFTVVFFLTWPWNGREDGVDLLSTQTFLLFSYVNDDDQNLFR